MLYRSLAFTACLTLCGNAAAPLDVVGITGDWTAGKQRLVVGSSVPADATLSGSAGATIMLGAPDARYFKRCDAACTFTPSSEKPQNAAGGIWERLVAAVRGQKQEGVIAAVSRGAIGRNLNDAVVRMEGGRVDVAPAFRGVTAGTMRVQLDSLPEATVNWSRGGALWLPAGSLRPGLYTLTLEGNARAVVLVTPTARFAQATEDYQHAVAATSDWPRELDAGPALRAFLESLVGEAK